MSFPVDGAGALDSFAAFAGSQQDRSIQQQQQMGGCHGGSSRVLNGYTSFAVPVDGRRFPVEHGVQPTSANDVGPPSPVSQTDSHDGRQHPQPGRTFELPVHTVQMAMPAQDAAAAGLAAPAPISAPVQAPASASTQEQPAEEQLVEEEAAPKRARRTKERVRRIHLPVREGMDELSSSEGSGSEWDEPVLAAGQTLPPGYSGKRRVKKPADGKIKPAYYYPTEGSTRGVPVFEPTYEEFKDFNS